MGTRMLSLLTIMLAGALILSGCNKTENNPKQEPEVGMANPASVYCVEQGGTLIPAEDEEGNQFAFCQIDEDTICEEWEYFRGECPVEEVISDEETNSDEETSEEVNEEEIDNEEVREEANNEELPVAKMRIADDLTEEEIENQINETCGNMGGVWEEGSCVLEDGSIIQF